MKKFFLSNLWIYFVVFFIISIILCNTSVCFAQNAPSFQHIETYIEDHFNSRNQSIFNGNISSIASKYNTSVEDGRYALDHEVRRIKYLRDWASQRGITFTSINSNVVFKNMNISCNGSNFRVDEEWIFKYIYDSDETPTENIFGINLFHMIDLINTKNGLIINKDWYLDCFEDALKSYDGNYSELLLPSPTKQIFDFSNINYENVVINSTDTYNRLKAIEYADKFSGVPSLSQNTDKYNNKYINFTGAGGNCTNYVSQCLGDVNAGNLKKDFTWYTLTKDNIHSDYSPAWVNADAFRNYFVYGGRGALLQKGTFKDIVNNYSPTDDITINKLAPGDVISYAKGNDIDHTAIITAFDNHGYPLINSHTVDRYHVPFDLGWGDDNILFHLIHIK